MVVECDVYGASYIVIKTYDFIKLLSSIESNKMYNCQ